MMVTKCADCTEEGKYGYQTIWEIEGCSGGDVYGPCDWRDTEEDQYCYGLCEYYYSCSCVCHEMP